MSPSITIDNVANKRATKPKVIHNLKNSHLAGIVKPTNFKDGFIFKFGTLFSFVSAFFGTVLHVLFPRAGGQVIRIHTSRVVALVHNIMANRNRSNEVIIGESVDAADLSVEHERAVSLGASCPAPNPASSQFGAMRWNRAVLVNFFKESSVCGHKQKTPTKHEVKPGQCSGNVFGRCQILVSLFFAAALRPSELYHNRPFAVN